MDAQAAGRAQVRLERGRQGSLGSGGACASRGDGRSALVIHEPGEVVDGTLQSGDGIEDGGQRVLVYNLFRYALKGRYYNVAKQGRRLGGLKVCPR